MRKLLARYAHNESGASAIEYGLVASLVSVAIIGGLAAIGINLRGKGIEIAEAIGMSGN
jgi:pilus assembly protein Flp/PilA